MINALGYQGCILNWGAHCRICVMRPCNLGSTPFALADTSFANSIKGPRTNNWSLDYGHSSQKFTERNQNHHGAYD